VIVLKRNTIIVIVVIVVIILAVVGVFAYQQVQQREALRNIKVSVEGFKVESVTLSSATVNFSLRFTNPNSNPATLDRTDFTVYINNISVGSGQNLQKVTIPAGGSAVIPIPFTFSYTGVAQSLFTVLQQALQQGGVGLEWRLVGTAFFDSPLGTVSVPYDFSGTT
jgi:LEA14-like dessication related protein